MFEYGEIENDYFHVYNNTEKDFQQIIKDYKLGLLKASVINNIDYLELVITCVNFSDYLKLTLPYNIQHFDNVVIVTDINDINTQILCAELDVSCILTDVFYKDDAVFNKGAGINVGISNLKKID